MTQPLTRIRRNIHTYPFKYRHLDPGDFFSLEKAVIYIHIPFCSTKCHFCDYVVQTNSTADLRQRYVDAVCREIVDFPNRATFPGFTIDGIYVGGGTPGLLEADQLIRLLDTVRDHYPISADAEVGVEFDPACCTEEKLTAIREAGYNRLSTGIQSFDEGILRDNNRPHDLADVHRAWEAIGKSGFTHTNIDLIYPLFGLTMEVWEDSLQKAIDMGLACITAYPLEVWPKTAYFHWLKETKRELPKAQDEAKMARLAFDMLEAAGYVRASTSGYYHPALTKRYCRYLDYYWRTWPMIGFGVSSKTVIHNRLYTNLRSIRDYVTRMEDGEPIMDFATYMDKRQEMRRVMIRGLKMCEVFKGEFLDRFGVEMESVFGQEIADLVQGGLLVSSPESIYLTREGQVHANNAFEKFYTADDLRAPQEGEVQFGISELVAS